MKNLGPQRLAVVGGVILAFVAFFIYLMTRLGTPQMELLYSNLSQDDSRQIVGILSREQISYDVAQEGAEIFVSSDQVGAMRLKIAEQGLPTGASVGYEVFDNADSIGSTNFQQNVNLVRALEGELSRTIRTIGSVRAARVHLVLPRRELFSRERQQPSASIVLKMNNAERLTKEQISAVQHLVASSVPDLKPERISIVDDKGTLLARGFDSPGNADKAQEIERQRLKKQEAIARRIESLLERTVGFGKVRAEVYADMDFSRETSVEEEYDPEGQVVRSSSTAEESEESNQSENDMAVTVANNLPDADAGGGSGATAGSRASRTQETVNYEISKKIINRVRETAVVNRLSVAVLVDGIYTRGEDGTVTYEPRTQEEMDQISTLVQSAIGFTERRDRVDVINMRFAAIEEIDDTPEIVFWIFTKPELMKAAEYTVLGLVGILIILLVVRPLIKRVFEQQAAAEAAAIAEAEQAALAGPAGVPVPSDTVEEDDSFEELIDIDRVEGRVKASSVKKVGEIVDKHPEEALAIVRNWMYQEG